MAVAGAGGCAVVVAAAWFDKVPDDGWLVVASLLFLGEEEAAACWTA